MLKTKRPESVVGRSAARLVVALGVAFGIVTMAGIANAGSTSVSCTTDIIGTVNANVVVPTGAFCALDSGAVVNGNISVERDGTLFVGAAVAINGNIEARARLATTPLVLLDDLGVATLYIPDAVRAVREP